MGRGTLTFSLAAICLGASFLHAQIAPRARGSHAAQHSDRGSRQQMLRRFGPVLPLRAAANNTSGVAPDFAGFYTAPFLGGVAPVSAGSTRITFLTADVNHDGHPDLLSIDSNGGIAAALNDGTGHFAAPVITAPTPATTHTVDAMASDVNGDGYPDVVVLTGGVPGNNGPGPQQFVVLINQKNGTFQVTATLTPANEPGLYADWNPFSPALAWTLGATRSSGLPDIVAEYLTSQPSASPALFARTVFPNDGSGNFSDTTQSTTTVPLPGGGLSPASLLTTPRLLLRDVNHDGKPDLLTPYVLPLASPFQMDIAFGNGDGTFAAPLSNAAISVPYGSGIPNHFALADLTGSTSPAPDLLLSGDNSVFMAAANGDGTYRAPVLITQESFKGSESVAGFQAADVNGDGLPDLLVIRDGALAALPGKGNETFGPAVNTVVTNTGDGYEPGIAFADFDGDGKLDFIAAAAGSADVVFGKGRGDGNFVATSFVEASSASVPSGNFALIAALDLNGDGKTDLLGLNEITGDIFAAFATPGGSFTFKPTLSQISLGSGMSIRSDTADFNGDGKSDLIVEQNIAGSAPTYTQTEKIGVALSNGDGSFQDPVFMNLPAAISPDVPPGIAAGDLDGDGKLDLALVYSSQGTTGNLPGGYCVVLGKGDGTFSPGVFTQFGATPTDVLLEHFHGSKAPLDMVIGDRGERTGATPKVSMLKGNGDGTFGAATTIESGQNTSGLLSGDFNKDGHPDLVIPINYAYGPPPNYTPNFDQDGLALYPGNGDGSFSAATTLAPGSNPYYPITADVNGDGNADILYDSSYAGADDGLTVLLGHGDGTFAAAARYPMPAQSYLAAGTFLGDNAQSIVAGIPGAGAALVMNQGGTAVALTLDGSTLSAKVAATLDGRPVPTGTGTFLDGATVLGTSALSNGVASADASGLTVGTHTITFQYGGDTNFQPNTVSSAITVTTAPAPDFTMSSNPGSITLSAGQSGMVTLSIAANAGLSGNVSFACTGLPAESACSFSPATLAASPGQTSSATLTITTTAPSSARMQPPVRTNTAKLAAALGFLLAVPLWGRRRQRLWMLVAVAALGISSLAGCSGGISTQNPPPNTGSPAGSYSVTVTATSMQVSHTLPLKVVIQ